MNNQGSVRWSLKSIAIKDLKPHRKNPRHITKEQSKLLQELIEKFGLIDKPIVNSDMTIIGGHQRIAILKKMKSKEIECWVPDRLLADDEIDRLCIGLNLNQGQWSWDVLANEWDPIDLLQWGFTESQLLGHFEEPEKVDEEKKQDQKKVKSCPNCGHEF